MSYLTRVQRFFLRPRLEPIVVTGGLFLFTFLYYTRRVPLQVLSFMVMAAVIGYWSYAIRHGSVMSLDDFKLTTNKLGRNVILAIGLAIFGWFFFSAYIYASRGHWLRFGYGGSALAVLTIVAVASAEELFFRGYLQNRLSHSCSLWKRVLIAVFAMALYKNVIHLWDGMALVLHVELLLLGILHNVLPSLWMEWSGSLVGPLLLHVIWDLLVYAPLGTIPDWVI